MAWCDSLTGSASPIPGRPESEPDSLCAMSSQAPDSRRIPDVKTLTLYPVPDRAWQAAFERLMKNPYLRKKYDRERRLQDKVQYVEQFAAEIKNGRGRVLDLGPGPGEFLEVAAACGCDVLGIDSALGESEMGDEYLLLSRLMTARQQLPVWYVGFDRLLAQPFLPFADRSFAFINSQGSIEQIFREHMAGPRHRETKNATLLSWDMSAGMARAFERLFSEFHRILDAGGTLLIYGNGARNVEEYDHFIQSITSGMSLFALTYTRESRLHKMIRKGR